MQMYDDYAMSPENFEIMAKEYNINQNKVLSLKTKACEINQDDVKLLFNKIEYLRVLVDNLKNHTSNIDILKVLDDVAIDIQDQTKQLSEVLGRIVKGFDNQDDEIKIFCNNLKLAINTAGDIIKLLVKIKDEDETFELSPKLTNNINEFVDINNQLVSLFGECRYRGFAIYRK